MFTALTANQDMIINSKKVECDLVLVLYIKSQDLKAASWSFYNLCNLTQEVYVSAEKRRMHLLLQLSLTSLFLAGGLAAPLPCDSNLRIVLPHLFSHCECQFSEWSEWENVPDTVVNVSTAVCNSSQAYDERRTRSAIGQMCEPVSETRQVCKFSLTSFLLGFSFWLGWQWWFVIQHYLTGLYCSTHFL